MTSPASSFSADDVEEPGRDAWLAVGVTTLVFFLVVIDVSAVNVVFPSMSDDFEVSEATLGWVISGYNITVAALLMVAGRYADSIGRKKLFLPGVGIFMLGSLLSGLAPNATLLIAARVVQGIGGAIISPTAIAVVLPAFPAHKRSSVIGITGATGALGAVAGPAIGAFVTEAWSWRGVFLINVPLCLLVLALSPKLLTESKNPNATGRVDLLGVPIGTAGVALVMFAIVRSESNGLGDPLIAVLFVTGIALIAALVRRSRRHPEPLIETDLFRHRSFTSTNLLFDGIHLGLSHQLAAVAGTVGPVAADDRHGADAFAPDRCDDFARCRSLGRSDRTSVDPRSGQFVLRGRVLLVPTAAR
jgi:MFS family permease